MADSPIPLYPILLVDDEPAVLSSESALLRSRGYTNIIEVNEAAAVLDIIAERGSDLVLLDLTMPGLSGTALLKELRERHPEVPVIVVTGTTEIDTAVECMQLGAVDYIVKSDQHNRFSAAVEQALETRELRRAFSDLRSRMLDQKLRYPEAFEMLVTRSPKMYALFLVAESIARTRETVLITGETGVGKELIAEAIHRASGREGSFLRVNTAGLDDHVFADTLFGHRKGAFTGATEARAGLVRSARSGTIFLDEIGDLSPVSQVKLLQLLERREYLPLGSDLVHRTEARFVIATNQELSQLVESGSFRRDLYYRLATHSLHVPPLRERREDITPLLSHFVARACEEMGPTRTDGPPGATDRAGDASPGFTDLSGAPNEEPTAILEIPPHLPRILRAYDFPGNVRELRAMVYNAAAQSHGRVLETEPFRRAVVDSSPSDTWSAASESDQPEPSEPGDAPVMFGSELPSIRNAVDQLIDEALRRSAGIQSTAAALLGITPQALSKRLQRRQSGRMES